MTTTLGLVSALLLSAQAGTNLRGYWPLDETSGTAAADASGNGRAGTHAGPTAVAPSPRALNVPNPACRQFDGTDDRTAVADHASLRFTAAQSFTVSAWVNASAVSGAWKGIVTKSRRTAPWYGLWISNGNKWTFGGPANIAGPDVQTGVWTHLAAVQDVAGNQRILYVNGASAGTGALQAGDGTGDLWIGGADSVNEYFAGQIDEVRIHDRALTLAEIQYLAAGNGPPAAPGTPTAVAGVGQIQVDWTASPTSSPSAPTYSLYSGPTAGAATAPEASGLSTLSYTDAAASGATVFYAVSAVNFAGEGPVSAAAGATALFPAPRTNDHDEGLFDDRCSCGTIAGPTPLLWPALLLVLGLGIRRRTVSR